MSRRLAHSNCLVTGASSGLGAAVAAGLVERGCTVWGTARDAARVQVPGARPLALDLADREQVNTFIADALPGCGEIDLLVNNAGAGVFGRFAGLEPAQVERQLELLLAGPMRLARAVLPGMLARGRGCIVNVSSLAARFPLPCMMGYNVGKAGLSMFSQCLAEETRGTGVRVIDFMPGDFRTGFNRAMERADGPQRTWEVLERELEHSPPVDAIAARLLRAIDCGAHGPVKAGRIFQRVVAPVGQRLLPGRVFRALLRSHFA